MTGTSRPAQRRRLPDWWLVPLRTAGPSAWWVAVAVVIGAGVGAALIPFGLWHPWLAAAFAGLAAAIAGRLDRDALTIRLAVVDYAAETPTRAAAGFPRDEPSAEAWIADPAHAAGDPIERAYVLSGLHRTSEALDVLAAARPTSNVDVARAERLRLALAPDGPIDRARFDEALRGLAVRDRRYQELALAVMLLDRDLRAGRPWRVPFLAAVRSLAPFAVTGRARLLVVTQQYAWGFVFAVVAIVLLAVELVF